MESSATRADAFVDVWKSKTNRQTFHRLGNHDLAAWNDKSAAYDPLYGKGLLRAKLGIDSPHHSFDRKGRHRVRRGPVFPYDRVVANLPEVLKAVESGEISEPRYYWASSGSRSKLNIRVIQARTSIKRFCIWIRLPVRGSRSRSLRPRIAHSLATSWSRAPGFPVLPLRSRSCVSCRRMI